MIRGQWEIPNLIQRIADEQRRWNAVVGVESVGAFAAIPQFLRRANPSLGIHAVKRTTDKVTASLEASAWWARGDIRVPPSAPWLAAFLREVTGWTGTATSATKNDDQIDALSIALTLRGLAQNQARRARQRAQLSAIAGWPF